MDVGIIDARDLWIRHDYERKVAKRLYAVGEAYGNQGEAEVGRGEKGFCGERGATMPGIE